MPARTALRWLLVWCGTALAGTPAAGPPGVSDPQLAWQHWALNCQGCHRTDGSGSKETAPSLAGMVARFTNVAGGRQYLARVPGVATAPLSDADLAQLLNWTLWRFDAAHLKPDFKPYSAQELAGLRGRPLRTEAARERARLIAKLNRSNK
jgi:cytochrome c553